MDVFFNLNFDWMLSFFCVKEEFKYYCQNCVPGTIRKVMFWERTSSNWRWSTQTLVLYEMCWVLLSEQFNSFSTIWFSLLNWLRMSNTIRTTAPVNETKRETIRGETIIEFLKNNLFWETFFLQMKLEVNRLLSIDEK